MKSDTNGIKVVVRGRDPVLTISGRVIDEQGSAMKGKIALFTTDNNTPAKLTDAVAGEDGAFKLEAKTPTTSFQFLRVVFVSDSGRIAWRSIPKCSGSFQIQLEPETKIAGMVVDARGAAIEGAKVTVYQGKDRTYGELIFGPELREFLPGVQTDVQGRFVLGGLPRGAEISIIADHDGFE